MYYFISSGVSIIFDYWRSGSYFEFGYLNVIRFYRMYIRDIWIS